MCAPVQPPSIWCDGGFARHEAFWARVAGVSDAHVVQFPPINRVQAMPHVGAQNADHLAEKCLKYTDIGEVVCTLGAAALGMACC